MVLQVISESMQICGEWSLIGLGSRPRREEGGPVPKLVWWVKLVAELRAGVMAETEVARIERGEEAGSADLGLRLDEVKQLTAAVQAQIVPAQAVMVGEGRRWCAACERPLASKGYYSARFRFLFGGVPARIRRLVVCSCQDLGEPKSFAASALSSHCGGSHGVSSPEGAVAPFPRLGAVVPGALRSGAGGNRRLARHR